MGMGGLTTGLMALMATLASGQWMPPANKTLWATKTVYQVLVDRLDKGGDGPQSRCPGFNLYCGGTWAGTTKLLPYLRDMGFDAVWFSPVHEQTAGPSWEYPDGYHGFWPRNIFNINSQFGSAADLREMIDTMHALGMWSMLDTVPNHSGYGATGDVGFFNDSSYYHSCDGCVPITCGYSATSDEQIRRCRLSELPDLNQDIPFVADTLLRYHQETWSQWHIDGYRIDAARHVEVAWLNSLRASVPIFTIGEFATTSAVIRQRLSAGALDSSLNFPLNEAIVAAWVPAGKVRGSMQALRDAVQVNRELFADVKDIMGNFVDNHDQSRIMCTHHDVRSFENAIAFLFFTEGFPIYYFGGEVGLRGQRDPLWQYRDANTTQNEVYVITKRLISVRKTLQVWSSAMTDVNVTSSLAEYLYAFVRGGVFVMVNNLEPRDAPVQATAQVNLGPTHANTVWRAVLMSYSSPGVPDEFQTDGSGLGIIHLNRDRFPQVYVLSNSTLLPANWPVSSGLDHFLPYLMHKSSLGPDGAALVATWVLSLVSALFLWVSLKGWLNHIPFVRGWRTRLGVAQSKRTNKTLTEPGQGALNTHETSGAVTATISTPTLPEPPRELAMGIRSNSRRRKARPQLELTTSLLAPEHVVVSMDISPFERKRVCISTSPTPVQIYSSSTSDAHVVEQDLPPPRANQLPAPVNSLPSVSESVPGHARKRSLFEEVAGQQIAGLVLKECSEIGKGVGQASPTTFAHEDGLSVDITGMAAKPEKVYQGMGPTGTLSESLAVSRPAGQTVANERGQRQRPALSILSTSMEQPSLTGLTPRPMESTTPRIQFTPQASESGAGTASGVIRLPSRRQIVAPLWLQESRILRSLQSEDAASRRSHTQVPTMGSTQFTASSMLRSQNPMLYSNSSVRTVQDVLGASCPAHTSPDPDPNKQGLEPLGMLPEGERSELIPKQVPPPMSVRQSMINMEANFAGAYGMLPGAVDPAMILHVAMEYSIPHLSPRYDACFMFGGLGKVVDLFLKEWPGPMGLLCPLYAEAYNSPTDDKFPSFVSNPSPQLSFTVVVARRHVTVELFVHRHRDRTYFFLQADIFRHRKRANIYGFDEESEMLTWCSVFNQAASVVITTFDVHRVQFHDWHGSMSLLYLPAEVRPQVILVVHNGHYNGVFPAPNKTRKLYIFSVFDMDETLGPLFLEHKGNVDMLNGVLTWLKMYQNGVGCVAVSPRYARQVHDKLSVFWALRGRDIHGIMNALPLTNCLAHDLATGSRTLDEIIALKTEAKAKFAAQFGLDVGKGHAPFEGPQLVVFLGRMTHQKGCDTIARAAADHFMEACPNCVLVMVGPVGDTTGAEAQGMLMQIAPRFPGRVYAPPGIYFSGAEKDLLLEAADFCLVPSRFEPCGLVDIEFGWNGAVIVGHDTGGLGKMPGIYYTVESSASQHLAAQLGKAVVTALALSPERRRELLSAALATRFPTEVMMHKYKEQWALVDASCEEVQKEHIAAASTGALLASDEFYSTLWRKHNLQDITKVKLAREQDVGRVMRFVQAVTGFHVGRPQVSSVLLLVMQSFCALPTLQTMGFVVHVYLGIDTISGCQDQWDISPHYWPDPFNNLGFRVILMYAIYTGFAPLWCLLALYMPPHRYIRLVAWSVLIAAVVAQACMYWTLMINVAIIVTSIVAPSGVPLIALNYLGRNIEVSETALNFLTVTEVAKALFITGSSLLAVLSRNNVAFVACQGMVVFSAALFAAWFSSPGVLHPAYKHIRLVLRKQWGMIIRICSFWLTSLVMVTDNVALVLTAYSTLLRWRLGALIALLATAFGATALSILTNWGLSHTRWYQLRVQTFTMLIAAMPGYAIAKQLAVMYSRNLSGVFATVGLVEYVYGSRGPLIGLLAFQTLPTRELVGIWQLLVLIISTAVPFVVLIAGFTSKVDYSNTTQLLVGVIICEGVRLLAMLGLKIFHNRENLATL